MSIDTHFNLSLSSALWVSERLVMPVTLEMSNSEPLLPVREAFTKRTSWFSSQLSKSSAETDCSIDDMCSDKGARSWFAVVRVNERARGVEQARF